MKVNVSQIEDYITCPTLWWNRWIAKRSTRQETHAMHVGTTWHKLCEMHSLAPLEHADLTDLERCSLVLGYNQYRNWLENDPGAPIIIGREQVQTATLGGHELFGRLDAVGMWNGKWWHIQHKTLGARVDTHVYQRLLARSLHELIYAYLLQQNEATPYGGSMICVLRKPTSFKNLEQRPDLFSAIPVAITKHNIQTALLDVAGYLHQMNFLAHNAPAARLTQNRQACGGYYHNSPCEYIDVCDGLRSLETFPMRDPLAHYKEKP